MFNNSNDRNKNYVFISIRELTINYIVYYTELLNTILCNVFASSQFFYLIFGCVNSSFSGSKY